MISMRSTVLLAGSICSFLVHVGMASRANSSDTGPADEMAKIFGVQKNLVCGSHEVRKMLSDLTLDSVQTFPWEAVKAKTDAYLKETVQREIEHATREIESIQARLDKLKSNPEVKSVPDEAIKQLILKSVSGASAFTSLDLAKKSKCGKQKVDNAFFGGPQFKGATQTFAAEAAKVFTGNVQSPASFNNICMALVLGPDDKSDSWCDELCIAMGQIANELSAHAPVGTALVQLETLMSEARSRLDYQISEKEECTQVQETLKPFSDEIKSLTDEAFTARDAVYEAQEELEDLQDSMDDLEDDAEGQRAAAEQALQDFNLAEADRKKYADQLAIIKQKNKELVVSVQSAKEALTKTQKDLADASSAKQYYTDLMNKVVATMLQMVFYFKAAVADPVSDLGLGVDTQISDYWFREQGQEPESLGEVRQSLQNMDSYCEKTAKPAFKVIQSSCKAAGCPQDLDSVCSFGGKVDEIAQQVDASVEAMEKKVANILTNVQSWLDPYKGQPAITEQKVKELRAKGEPEGLREVVGVFGKTKYYMQYLKSWKYTKDGSPFLTAKDKLLSLLEQLGQKEAECMRKEQEVVKAQKDGLEEQKKYADMLKQALAAGQVAKGKEADATAKLDQISKELAKSESDLSELERKLASAQKEFEEAKDLLMGTYRKGAGIQNSLLQLWEDMQTQGLPGSAISAE